uniref:Cell division control protein 45-like protein n=1 Tax=Parasteatoda tepidariorum TaxID=114398 RepID=A0A2L2YGM4_PARTP
MFVSNIRTEFYDVLSTISNRILLLVGYDVDALCACKILQYLFQCDNVLYTLIPVYSKTSLVESFKKHKEKLKFAVLINCGSTIDLVEVLEPEDDVVFFICDSQRPINVYNIYSETQIRLVMKPEDCENIPAYTDIFRDEDSADEDEEMGRPTEETIMRRRDKRLWEENRNKIMFEYSQISYFGESSSCIMFDLAWKMSRDNNDLLWWSIIGFTEQFVMNKVESDKYIMNASLMQNHVTRLNCADVGTFNSVSCMKISFDKELNLSLYRHWSIYDSMLNSKYTACKFKLWSGKGKQNMREFLASIGLPLSQCRQKFLSMDMEIRNNVCSWMEANCDKYRLDQMVFGSFNSQFGFKGKFSATDVVLAISALLESTEKEKTAADKFQDASDALRKGEVNAIKRGIELAKLRLEAIFKQVQNFIALKHVRPAGPFLHATVPTSTHDFKYFCYPSCLTMLGNFLLEAHVCSRRSNRAGSLPLILFAPDEQEYDQCMVVGIPPLSERSPRNFFGKAFEQAAEQARIFINQDLFYTSIVYIKRNDQAKFLDALFLLLS